MEVDITFRSAVNRIVVCSRIGKEPKDFSRITDTRDFRFEVMNTFDGSVKTQRLSYEKAKPYFKFYDTLERVKIINEDLLEYELMRKNPKKYNKQMSKRIKYIGDSIKPYLKKITHSSVKLAMLDSGFSKEYEEEVYAYLQGNVSLN
jgi:hypothetical protein